MLVRGLMKRRFWWTIVDKPEDAHFAWTQLKNPELIKHQCVSPALGQGMLMSSLSSQSFNCDGLTPREEPEVKSIRSRSSKKRYKSTNDSDT